MKQSNPSSRPVAFPRKTGRFALSERAVFRGHGLMRWLLGIAIYTVGCSSGTDAVVNGEAGVDRIGAAIVGGAAVEESDFSAVVSLGGCSGTLVHPSLVVYAAHCGTAIDEVRFGARSKEPTQVVRTDRCRSFPGAKLGDGTDLAYCVLQEAVAGIEPERILAGCEVDDFRVGDPAILVGFGVAREGGTYGRKRVAATSIADIGDELLMAQGNVDTCRGDSGGPVFVERRDIDGREQRRLVGVTSAGTEAECGSGIGHYVNLTRKIDWLEEDAQLDLTPCFDQAEWSPTPRCVETAGDVWVPGLLSTEPTDAAVPDASAPDAAAPNAAAPRAAAPDAAAPDAASAASEQRLLGSCGAPFEAAPDRRPPIIEWASPTVDDADSASESGRRLHFALPDGDAYVEFELAVDATDSGWGLEQVIFSLFAEDGERLFQRVDQIAPYGLPIFRVPPGQFTLRAEAWDFTGKTDSTEVDLQVGDPPASETPPAAACSASPNVPSDDAWQALAFLFAVAFALGRSGTCRRVS
jgi:hypothetical protein